MKTATYFRNVNEVVHEEKAILSFMKNSAPNNRAAGGILTSFHCSAFIPKTEHHLSFHMKPRASDDTCKIITFSANITL